MKDIYHVKPITVGKPQVIESLRKPIKASIKMKDLRREGLLSKYLREVTEYYFIDPHKAPTNHIGRFI